MNMIISIIIFFLIMTLIVSLHEAGHFFTAKKFGVYCKEFAIGMGTKIWSRKTAETEYSIRLLPMGGFVQMIGEEGELLQITAGDMVWITLQNDVVTHISYLPENETSQAVEVVSFDKGMEPMTLSYKEAESNQILTKKCLNLITCVDEDNTEFDVVANTRQFTHLSPGKKIIVLSAGVIMNFVLGFILVIISTFIGGVNVDPIIASDLGTVAYGDAFIQNDRIISVDGQNFETIESLGSYIQQHANTTVDVVVERQSDTGTTMVHLTRHIQLATGQNLTKEGIVDEEYGVLGITYQKSHTNIGKILLASWAKFIWFFQYVYLVLVGLFSGAISINNMTGFIGIAQQTNMIMTMDNTTLTIGQQILEVLGRLSNFAAFLSVNIGVMNLLPIPALDGGRIVFAIYELIFKKKPNAKFETYINTFGFILLILLFISVTIMDIFKLFQ